MGIKKTIWCLILGWCFTGIFVTLRVFVQDGNPGFNPDAVISWYLKNKTPCLKGRQWRTNLVLHWRSLF